MNVCHCCVDVLCPTSPCGLHFLNVAQPAPSSVVLCPPPPTCSSLPVRTHLRVIMLSFLKLRLAKLLTLCFPQIFVSQDSVYQIFIPQRFVWQNSLLQHTNFQRSVLQLILTNPSHCAQNLVKCMIRGMFSVSKCSQPSKIHDNPSFCSKPCKICDLRLADAKLVFVFALCGSWLFFLSSTLASYEARV
jgi:hypothetical protein